MLRVEGTPDPYRVNGIGAAASRTGIPHVRLQIARLVVNIYDRAALTAWTEAWTTVEHTAARIWPQLDAFEEAEQWERRQIAKTGVLEHGTAMRR